MKEIEGRFLSKAHRYNVRLTSHGLSVDGIEIISKRSGGIFSIAIDQPATTTANSRAAARLDKVMELLNQSKFGEAIFLCNFVNWNDLNLRSEDMCKAGFRQTEPRDYHGRWTNEISSNTPNIQEVQYRGKYHDQVVQDIIAELRAQGSTVLQNVKVLGLNAMVAIPDGASKPPGAAPYFFEVKTGLDPKPTEEQKFVYPLICLGGHATSTDPRVADLGLKPGVPFPPMDIWFILKSDPSSKPIYFNYCDAIGIRGKFHVH